MRGTQNHQFHAPNMVGSQNPTSLALQRSMHMLCLGLGIGTQYLSGIDRNNPVPSRIVSVPVKRYLQSITLYPSRIKKKCLFLWFWWQPITASVNIEWNWGKKYLMKYSIGIGIVLRVLVSVLVSKNFKRYPALVCTQYSSVDWCTLN